MSGGIMMKLRGLKRGLAILLSIVMVVGLLPGVGTMKVSAAEGEETAAGVTFTALDGNPEGFNGGNDERYHNLFDGTATTKWCCEFINPSYVIFKASQPIYVSGYTIWTGNDTGEDPGRNPTEWTLSACNDYDETNKSGGTWQAIDTVTDGRLREENLADTTFTIPETKTAYRYFKLNITSINYANTMQLGELALSYRAKSCATHDWAYTRTVAPTCTEDGYDVETCSNCGQVQHTNQKPALGHTFENGSCTVCGSGKVQFTATAGTDGVSESEDYAMLLDKKYSSIDENDYSKWCVVPYRENTYIIFAASDPINVKGYTIVTGDDNEEYGGRNPKNWTLYGCNDPEANSESGRYSGSWHIIHSVSDDTVLQDKNCTPYKFTLDAPTEKKYQYFMLEITDIKDQGAGVMQMSEFILDYSTCEHNWVKTETTIPPTCTEGGYDVYQCTICQETNNVANGTPVTEHTFENGKCTVCGSRKQAQFTATAGTAGASSNEDYPMLLDKKYSSTDENDYSKWCVDPYSGGTYIIFAASDPIIVKGYTIVTGNDNEEENGRNPKSWTLYGCNDPEANSADGRDSSSWQIIHSVSDDTVLQDKNYTPYTFTLDAPTAAKYQYFKLEITEIQGQSKNVMQMSEFILDYSYCEHNWVKTETTIPPTCTEGGYDVYQCSICHATNNVANGSTAEHTWVKGESVAPTCAEDGYTPQTCSNCGATQKTGIIPAPGHDFDNRQCTRCGVSDTALSRPKGDGTVESPYRISTVGELTWFAGLVNGTLDGAARNTSANAVLTTDIDFGNNNFAAIGTEAYPFSGTFDGSGHTITVNQNGSSDVALFGYLGNCTVKNLTVTGTIRTTEKFAAGIAMQTKTGTTATVENCVSNVTIESSIDGDGTHGGLIGMPQGAVNINNCAFTGAINGASTDSCGGMIGYAKGNVTIKNSYIAATFNLNETSCHTFSRNFATWVKLENCYYLNALGEVPANATQLTSEQFSSGEAAYRLQGEQTEAVWGQTLGENGDPYPVLGGMKVYKNDTYRCPGNRTVVQSEYSNTEKPAVYLEHDMKEVEAKAETCTEAGNIAYWVCAYEEGVYYTDEGRTGTHKTVVIPASGHEMRDDGVCSKCGIDIPYLSCDSDGRNWTTSTCSGAIPVTSEDTQWGASDAESWYVARGTVTIDNRVTVKGTVHLILADNCNLTINGGINVTNGGYGSRPNENNQFSIYAQSDGNQMGCLTIPKPSSSNADAGIGGDSLCWSGKITINGGNISSESYSSGAGIGGGRGYYGDVTINGGKVTAASSFGAGIGHGSSAPGGRGGVVINGGAVTASSENGAGIGGVSGGSGKVTIKGGVITATSVNEVGIGGCDGDGTVTITGSPVIFASSISDQSGKENHTWGGIIFEGDSGKVYGTLATVDADFTIPSGKILAVAKGETISIAENRTLTNEGTIYNSGTFTGAVTNNGTIHNTGTFDGELGGTVSHYTIAPTGNDRCPSVDLSLKVNGEDFTGTVTYALVNQDSNVTVDGSTLNATDLNVLGDTIPVTATFTVDEIVMTRTENIGKMNLHDFPDEFDVNGFKVCSGCKETIYQPAEIVNEIHHPELIDDYSGYYAIENAGQLCWFAGLVNGTLDGVARNTSANAVLATDIDFGNTNFVAIGTESYPFSGTFDGNGHTITVNQNGSSDVALFGYLGNSTVKNLTVTGTIATTTSKFAAGIAMQTASGTTATVENCVSDVTIESNIDGDGIHAGLIGVSFGAVNINNCAFTGAINGASTDSCGGMVGFAKGAVTIKNSYIAATFTLNSKSCHTFCRQFADTDFVTLTNCYYLNALGVVPANATQLTSEQFSSGEAAYRLQGEQTEAVWGQTLGENGDPYPVLGGMKVYKNETTGCIQITYSNTQLDPVNADHTDSDSNGVCDTCGAKIAYIITGRILDEAGQTINGDMQGLANYKPEEKVTLTAPVIAGYNFIGWYAYASESPFYTGDNLCTSRTYTFTAEEDRDLVAVYKAIGSAELTISGGKDFTINGAKKTTDVTTSYPMGSQITVVCNDSDFGYWKNSAGMVVSRNQSYTFTVTGKESISAVFNTIAENQVTVVFESSYGQVIARDQYASDAAITDPGLPFRYGYTALGWDYNGDGSYDAEADTFAKALERGFDSPEKLVTILPVYQLNNVTYKITVEGGTGAGIYKQNDVVTVEANAASEGMKFSHWVDKAGTILSYNEKYQFYAAKDITVTAVYVADTTEVEAKGTTEIIDMSADTANGKLTFVSMSTVPEGCTINKAGIIATNIEGVGTSGDGFNADTAAYVRGNAWTGNAYRFTWTKSKVASNETWYVRAHLVYTDAEGNVHTVYGDMVSQTMPASNQQ